MQKIPFEMCDPQVDWQHARSMKLTCDIDARYNGEHLVDRHSCLI